MARHRACLVTGQGRFPWSGLFRNNRRLSEGRMKRILLTSVVLGCATVWSVNAQDVGGRKGLTDEDSQQRKVLIEKYDVDGDGVLSKSEQKKLSKADKKALAKTGGVGTARKAPKETEPKRDGERNQERRQDEKQSRSTDNHSKNEHSEKSRHGKKS